MANDKSIDMSLHVTEAAGEWLDVIKQEPVTEAQRQAFVDWLLRSPMHVEEFIRVSALHQQLSGVLKMQPTWLEKIISEAQDNVVKLSQFEDPDVTKDEKTEKRSGAWMKVAAAVAGIAILAGVMVGQIDSTLVDDAQIVSTRLGEQRSVLLDDGSVVELNTDSEIRIAMDSQFRQVELLKGEAIFQVAKDPNRPFQVNSGSVMVEAIGTRFNVYRQDEEVIVTVVEGLVEVSKVEETVQVTVDSGNKPETLEIQAKPVAYLSAGNQVAVSQTGAVRQEEIVNLDKVIAWTDRRLVFDNDTLEHIVSEFNRYNRSSLTIVDSELRKRRLTGVFNANDPDAFLALMQSLGGVSIKPTVDGSRQLSRLDHQP